LAQGHVGSGAQGLRGELGELISQEDST